MGCDIHFVIEKKFEHQDHGTKWIGIYSTGSTPIPAGHLHNHGKIIADPVEVEKLYMSTHLQSRNYEFFAQLCGVRGENNKNYPSPKDMPDDASDLAVMESAEDGDDGHSHSWDWLKDFCVKRMIADEEENAAKLMKSKCTDSKYLIEQVSILSGVDKYNLNGESGTLKDYRVVYWFDN